MDAQAVSVRINPNIILPSDSTESKTLVSSLNYFLTSAQKPNEENGFVLQSEKIETFILLDEMKSVEKNETLKDDSFYKPYLINVVPIKDSQYLLQVSYIGIHDSVAVLRASFQFMAHKVNKSFLFSSPLVRNTRYWKTEKVGNIIFHYQNTINKSKAKEFDKLVTLYDSKLKSANKTTELYCCDNIMEGQKLFGVDYKSDVNGRSGDDWSFAFGDKEVLVLGDNNADFNNFDAHDLWHDRLSLVVSRKKVNRPVDEGCAYLYGGSWGLAWNEIFEAFKEQIASNKNISWIDIKENPVYFKTKGFNNSADYIVNGLLIRKIENEKGFPGVWELLNVGPFEKGNEKYYQVLERLTGINKSNYNDSVWTLINSEK